MSQPGTDWVEVGRDVLSKAKPLFLPDLLGKDVNRMTVEDLVLAAVLAAYLLEGHPASTARDVLRETGAAGGLDAFTRTLRRDVPDLEGRLRRWLEERG